MAPAMEAQPAAAAAFGAVGAAIAAGMCGKALHAVVAAAVRGAATVPGRTIDPIEHVQEALGALGVNDIKKGVEVLTDAGEKQLAGRLRKASRVRNAHAHPDMQLVQDLLEAKREQSMVKIASPKLVELGEKDKFEDEIGHGKIGKAVQQKKFESIANILMNDTVEHKFPEGPPHSPGRRFGGPREDAAEAKDQHGADDIVDHLRHQVTVLSAQLDSYAEEVGDLEKAQVKLNLQLKEYKVELDGLETEKAQMIDELQKKALLYDDLEAERARTRQAEGRAVELMEMLQQYKEVTDSLKEERHSSRAHGVGKGKQRREPR